jgi:hypothetical protein
MDINRDRSPQQRYCSGGVFHRFCRGGRASRAAFAAEHRLHRGQHWAPHLVMVPDKVGVAAAIHETPQRATRQIAD